jgi:hypothetical protein
VHGRLADITESKAPVDARSGNKERLGPQGNDHQVGGILADTIAMRRRWQGREFGDRERGKRCGSGFSPGDSIRTAHGGNLPCHVGWSRPGTFFWHDIKADPRVGIPIGERG